MSCWPFKKLPGSSSSRRNGLTPPHQRRMRRTTLLLYSFKGEISRECAVGGLWGAQGIATAMGTAVRFQSDPDLYCWTWKLPYGKLPNCRLYNHVFSDNRDDALMSYEVRFFDHPGAIPWKKAYLEGEHSWQQGPPDIGEETVLVRRQKDQRQHPAPPGLQPVRTFEERVASQARKAIRDRSRLKRQLEALAGPIAAPVSSSSSGSSSSSSSDTD